MRKRSKNCSGLEKEDGWWWKYRPVIVVLQSVNTLNKKADTNQLHCWRGGHWNIILKRHFRYHITIVYSKGYERRNPKLSQTTQEVASVRGSRLFTEFFFYYNNDDGDDDNHTHSKCKSSKKNKRRKIVRIIRSVWFNKETEPEKYFRELIMLFTSWRNDNTDLIGNCLPYQDYFSLFAHKINEKMKQYVVCNEDFH